MSHKHLFIADGMLYCKKCGKGKTHSSHLNASIPVKIEWLESNLHSSHEVKK